MSARVTTRRVAIRRDERGVILKQRVCGRGGGNLVRLFSHILATFYNLLSEFYQNSYE